MVIVIDVLGRHIRFCFLFSFLCTIYSTPQEGKTNVTTQTTSAVRDSADTKFNTSSIDSFFSVLWQVGDDGGYSRRSSGL